MPAPGERVQVRLHAKNSSEIAVKQAFSERYLFLCFRGEKGFPP